MIVADKHASAAEPAKRRRRRKTDAPHKPNPKVVKRAKRTSAEEIVKTQRIADILALRMQGWSLDAIGDAQEPPISAQRVHQIITEYLSKQPSESAEHVRHMETRRLDEMQIKLMENAIKGDLLAVDRVLAIQVRRASLLGLNCATKVESTGKDGGPIEHRVAALNDAAASFDAKFTALLAESGAGGVSGQPDTSGEGSQGV